MIDVWYGDEQSFGTNGISQRWINVLGRIRDSSDGSRLTYRLNGAAAEPLSIGPDYHRLAEAGDFNVEIDASRLHDGMNELQIFLTGDGGREYHKDVLLNVDKSSSRPLPYSVDWNNASDISDTVQITDGLWKKTDQGIRITEPYYDRVISFGDGSWENYEVESSVMFHGLRIPTEADGGHNVIHIAMALRWPGHDHDEFRPHRKWWPLGITAEFRLNKELTSGSWRMLGGAGVNHSLTESKPVRKETWYRLKGRVEDIEKGESLYRTKIWPDGQAEPEGWDISYRRPKQTAPSGSALLIAHYSIATFGNINVRPLS